MARSQEVERHAVAPLGYEHGRILVSIETHQRPNSFVLRSPLTRNRSSIVHLGYFEIPCDIDIGLDSDRNTPGLHFGLLCCDDMRTGVEDPKVFAAALEKELTEDCQRMSLAVISRIIVVAMTSIEIHSIVHPRMESPVG